MWGLQEGMMVRWMCGESWKTQCGFLQSSEWGVYKISSVLKNIKKNQPIVYNSRGGII